MAAQLPVFNAGTSDFLYVPMRSANGIQGQKTGDYLPAVQKIGTYHIPGDKDDSIVAVPVLLLQKASEGGETYYKPQSKIKGAPKADKFFTFNQFA